MVAITANCPQSPGTYGQVASFIQRLHLVGSQVALFGGSREFAIVISPFGRRVAPVSLASKSRHSHLRFNHRSQGSRQSLQKVDLYFVSWPLRKRSIATSLSAFQIKKLGSFSPIGCTARRNVPWRLRRAFNMDQDGNGDLVRRAEEREAAGYLEIRVT